MSFFKDSATRGVLVVPHDGDHPGPGAAPDSPRRLDHARAPYLEALREYAARSPGRYHVPGHKGGLGTDAELQEVLGRSALQLDVPLVLPGIDVGPSPTALEAALELAADAWGAKRTWFLSNGATQGSHAICVGLVGLGAEVVVQRNVHASTIDGLVLSGLRPRWVAPELNPDLGIAHCLTPEALDITLADSCEPSGVIVVSPTYYGAVADVRALAEVAHSWSVPLIVDEAWGSHFPFHEALPAHALSQGADLVLSGTHKMVGSLSQSAMLHLGHGVGELLDERVIDRALTLVSSTSPSSLLLASLDGARRNAVLRGSDLIEEGITALAQARAEIRAIPGLDVLDEDLLEHPSVSDYDPLRMAIDVRGVGVSGYELAELMRTVTDDHVELVSENMLVAVFGIAEPVRATSRRLVRGLSTAVARVAARPDRNRRASLQPPPRWGTLAMTPREAFLGRQESVPTEQAADRVAAESLAAYPPGIPNVFPGERLTTQTLSYLKRTLEHGGTVRGLSDPTMRTVRVVVEE
jgi:arginine decarboxylase